MRLKPAPATPGIVLTRPSQADRQPCSIRVRPRVNHDHFLIPVSLLVFLAMWWLIVIWTAYPSFILPSPARVGQRFLSALADGTLWRHTLITLTEAILGFILGFATGTSMGYVLAQWPRLEKLLSPYVVASQAIPIVALAPLLVLWFGSGVASKVLVCGLVVFFPILINTVVGLQSADEQSRELMRSLSATRWQTLVLLEVPAALPVLFGGIRMGITLSVIGAVVGEFVAADGGLGFLTNVARGLYDTPLLFVALFMLVAIGLVLYGIVILIERRVLSWRTKALSR